MLTEHEVEMRQRITRIESRICRIADSLNILTGDPGKTMWKINEPNPVAGVVCIGTAVLDASISDVIRYLTKEKIEDKVVCLYFEGQLVARIYPGSVP